MMIVVHSCYIEASEKPTLDFFPEGSNQAEDVAKLLLLLADQSKTIEVYKINHINQKPARINPYEIATDK